MSEISAWSGLSPSQYKAKKEADANRLIQRLEAILPGLSEAIELREVGTPRTHRRFLGRMGGGWTDSIHALTRIVADAVQQNRISGLYCVGDSCFPGQGLNAFSGYAVVIASVLIWA